MLMTFLRLLRILRIIYGFGLHTLLLPGVRAPSARILLRLATVGRRWPQSEALRLRLALEALGPIFVKFGQVLSTRRDLLPADVADELAKLQDRVPPFPSALAAAEITRGLGAPPERLFARFERDPVASASIAQVHFATLLSGEEVAVKVLRPGMLSIIEKDLALLRILARLIERLSEDGRRLRPREVVAEFDNYLHDELDLMREAANCSQLRRNFAPGTARGALLSVPEVHWEYCAHNVMTMERMRGIPISQTQRLSAAGIDLRKLAREGVEIFFTQVFDDGFFHADMHPGNIYVSDAPATLGRYIALDFGIVGSLSEFDKNYLAQNFLAFFRRDYRRVARLHIESGWVPPNTRENELEGAVRACCEPYFDKPLADISLGQVLLRLFQTSRRFNIEIQPQLVLLQKTLLNIEGLGRELDPNLDLWKTAKPYLERWMHNRIGWSSLRRHLRQEGEQWSRILPSLPRLAYENLSRPDVLPDVVTAVNELRRECQRSRRQRRWGWVMLSLIAGGWLMMQAGMI